MQEAAKLALAEATLGKWVRQDLNYPPSYATVPKFGLENPNNTFPFSATRTCTSSLSIKIISLNEPLDTGMERLITLEKAALRNPVKNLCIHLNVHVWEREKDYFKIIWRAYKATLVLLRGISPNVPDISACRSDVSWQHVDLGT